MAGCSTNYNASGALIPNLETLYEKECFKVYRYRDGFIIQNVSLEGFAHSHEKNFGYCLKAIEACIERTKENLSPYLMSTLIRITGDKKYKKFLKEKRGSRILKNAPKPKRKKDDYEQYYD